MDTGPLPEICNDRISAIFSQMMWILETINPISGKLFFLLLRDSTNSKLVVWVGGLGLKRVPPSNNPFHKGIQTTNPSQIYLITERWVEFFLDEGTNEPTKSRHQAELKYFFNGAPRRRLGPKILWTDLVHGNFCRPMPSAQSQPTLSRKLPAWLRDY